MFVELTQDSVAGYIAGCGRKVAALPEALASIAFASMLELLVDFTR